MKRGTLFIFLLLVSISLVSAQGSFSDLLDQLDQSAVVLSAIFIISFAIIFFSLSKSVFKDNTTISGIISAVISFLIIYGINKTGFDFEGFFYDIGLSGDILMAIIPFIIIGGVIFLIIKLKSSSLLVFGALLIGLSFFAYEGFVLAIIGGILFIVGLFLLGSKRKKEIVIRG